MGLNLYFSRGIVGGMGFIDFLMVPQEAPEGSAPRKLLGSFVDEIDHGPIFLKTKSSPSLNHAWQPGFFLTLAGKLEQLNGVELVQEAGLAKFSQEYKIETKAGLNAKAAFPGAPLSAGVEVDYSRLRRATVTFGPGSKKIYIPRNVALTAYEQFAEASNRHHPILFDPDVMLINQILLVRDLTVDVESKSSFGADFEAKATKVSDTQAGISFSRTGERKYAIQVNDGKDYLFGVGAIEANELVS